MVWKLTLPPPCKLLFCKQSTALIWESIIFWKESFINVKKVWFWCQRLINGEKVKKSLTEQDWEHNFEPCSYLKTSATENQRGKSPEIIDTEDVIGILFTITLNWFF